MNQPERPLLTAEDIANLRAAMDERRQRHAWGERLIMFLLGITFVSVSIFVWSIGPTVAQALTISLAEQNGLTVVRSDDMALAGPMVVTPFVVTATPTPTTIPTVTPHPASALAIASPILLRDGPSMRFEITGVIPEGQSALLVAKTPDCAWYMVQYEGRLSWISEVGLTIDFPDQVSNLPVISTEQIGKVIVATPTARPHPYPTPTAVIATPVPSSANLSRTFVRSTRGYFLHVQQEGYLDEKIRDSQYYAFDGGKFLGATPTQIIEINGDGSGHRIILSDFQIVFKGNDTWTGPHDLIHSPDGFNLAFVIINGDPKCLDIPGRSPCKTVAIMDFLTKQLIILEGPRGTNAHGIANSILDLEAPRWLQDGRLMVLAHPNEPADGRAYIYNIVGRGEPAVDGEVYALGVSHEAQKWYPWQPDGRNWQAGSSERADTYYVSQ